VISSFLPRATEIYISLVRLGNFTAGWFLPGFDDVNGHVILEIPVVVEIFLQVSPRLLSCCGDGLVLLCRPGQETRTGVLCVYDL
jgi:hypothetical protein